MTRANKNLRGTEKNFENMTVHNSYLYGLTLEEFTSGICELSKIFISIYTGMINEPHSYAMKNDDDGKGLEKNMNFLFTLSQVGGLNNDSIEANGMALATALKEAKVTKPETYFQILEQLGFIITGLGKKIEASEKITIEYPDNHYIFTALKSMTDAISMFTKNKPHKQCNVYFELLDHRVLINYPATEPAITMEYIMPRLTKESRDVVQTLCGIVEPLAKCNIKGGFGHYWTPTFTLKSTKRVIMSIKLTLDNHDVKLNLANLGKYTEMLDDFPAKIINEITGGGWGCGGSGCNPSCAGAFKFDLYGKSYAKCRGGSFVFHAPDKSETELLIRLLKKEIDTPLLP